jgi:truncated hemoglobin YjbI
MSKSEEILTLYDELAEWAATTGLGIDEVLDDAIDAFYSTVLEDRRLSRFFIGADLNALRSHQLTFLKGVFSEETAGGFTSDRL